MLDQALIDAALELAHDRFGKGRFCVAALRLANGDILTSVYVDAAVEGACLCAETGAICEAHKRGEAVVASVCIGRADANAPPYILPACGLCQERLAFWGLDVEIAIPEVPGTTRWETRTLRELRPYYWRNMRPEVTEEA